MASKETIRRSDTLHYLGGANETVSPERLDPKEFSEIAALQFIQQGQLERMSGKNLWEKFDGPIYGIYQMFSPLGYAIGLFQNGGSIRLERQTFPKLTLSPIPTANFPTIPNLYSPAHYTPSPYEIHVTPTVSDPAGVPDANLRFGSRASELVLEYFPIAAYLENLETRTFSGGFPLLASPSYFIANDVSRIAPEVEFYNAYNPAWMASLDTELEYNLYARSYTWMVGEIHKSHGVTDSTKWGKYWPVQYSQTAQFKDSRAILDLSTLYALPNVEIIGQFLAVDCESYNGKYRDVSSWFVNIADVGKEQWRELRPFDVNPLTFKSSLVQLAQPAGKDIAVRHGTSGLRQFHSTATCSKIAILKRVLQ